MTHRPAPPTLVLEDRAGGTQLMSAGKPGPELSSASCRELTGIRAGLGAQGLGQSPSQRVGGRHSLAAQGGGKGERMESEGTGQERSSFWGRQQPAACQIQVGGRLRTYQG